ncbi:hypothetical protein PspLS_02370 [Pyricularia sp. CBS 133598]|nr:hypothetical protein PspLS_02370 [Pyricularia sp. CBS 133598]
MKFSATSRAAPPAPLDFSHSQYNTPGSPDSSRPHSGDYTLSFPDSRRPNKRKDSSSSSKTSGSLGSWRKPSSPGTANAHSYCGRHSSQWLFSGWNVFRKGGV